MHAFQGKDEKKRAVGKRQKKADGESGRGSTGEEEVGDLWGMTAFASIPEDERNRFLDKALSKKHYRNVIRKEAIEEAAVQDKEGLKRLGGHQKEAVLKRKREATEWDQSEEVEAARSVAALERVVAAESSSSAKIKVLRDQIRVRQRCHGVGISELRAQGCTITGDGGVEVELARLLRVVTKRVQTERLGTKRPRPPPLRLRDEPHFPDQQAALLDTAHQAAVRMAQTVMDQLTIDGRFAAHRHTQPVHQQQRRTRKRRAVDQHTNEDLEQQQWQDEAGRYEVLKCQYDTEFETPVCFYFDIDEAEAAGLGRVGLLSDLQHPSVMYSAVTEVVEWINGVN